HPRADSPGQEPPPAPAVRTGVILRETLLFCLLVPLACGAPAQSSLLEESIENWLGERDHWAFTQRAVEYDGDKPRERLERYDPSRSGKDRWALPENHGRPPTADQQAAWAKKKFKKNRRRIDTPIGDFFDF